MGRHYCGAAANRSAVGKISFRQRQADAFYSTNPHIQKRMSGNKIGSRDGPLITSRTLYGVPYGATLVLSSYEAAGDP